MRLTIDKTERVGGRVYKYAKCVCGVELVLQGFTTTCECDRDYNWNGLCLAPREQWGEETGEHPADVVRIE
jgi:hypothetical protein